RVEHPLVGAAQLEPLPAERDLMLIQAPHLVAFRGLTPGAGHAAAPEIHLRSTLPDRELDRPPAEEVERSGMVLAGRGMIAGVDGRQPFAVAVQDETRERNGVGANALEDNA